MATITRSQVQSEFDSLIASYFPTGKNVLSQTDSPPLDEITPLTDAIAAYATLINPKKGYPGQNK